MPDEATRTIVNAHAIHIGNLADGQKDHEKRIRIVERLGFKIVAYALAGSFLGGAITTAVSLFIVK